MSTENTLCFTINRLLGGSLHIIKTNTEALVFARKETGLKVNADKPKCMVMSRD